MPIIINNIEQGTVSWYQEKLGKPSASNASRIITNDGSPSKQRTAYLHELAAEIITGTREEGYKNGNMISGQEMESESRILYEFIHGVMVSTVGVIYKDDKKLFLCSPDGIIDNKYGLEMKNVLPKTQVKYILDGKLPSEYFSQVQFSLYVSEFEFWDFLSYSPGIRPLIIRVLPDYKFLALLEKELFSFCQELESVVKKLQ